MKIEHWPLDKIIPYQYNPRNNDDAVEMTAKSIQEYGWRQPIVVDEHGIIICGHTRLKAAEWLGLDTAPVHVAEGLTDDQVRGYRIMDNRSGELATWDDDLLMQEIEGLSNSGFDLELTGFSMDDLGMTVEEIPGGNTDPDEIPEEPADPVTRPGDMWSLGVHRILCGDSTKAEDVERVMGGEKAVLLHADPPYGMGKEKDGVQNDNLYRDKLDAFQMQWWRAFRPYLTDNASVYIWGNAEDLWRLWYVGGLKDSERLTFRNEITWDKREDNPTMFVSGVPLESRRMYHPTERCLFFMLGEQGFNTNAVNYWDGWEPIRAYLEQEMKRVGWTVKDMNRITGTQMGGHWVTKSQWALITEEHYKKIQDAAKHDAFKREHDAFKREHDALKREHDALKRDFYTTRAYFDNTHDNMTDVWEYPRVTGEDRHGHATPKPVDMICRALKSSAPDGGVVAEPFLGSGSTLIAAEKTGRKCRAIEISPAYVDVSVQRWADFTGQDPVRHDGVKWSELTK
jgi:DNA modification methylase